jgi:hypothetical protein
MNVTANLMLKMSPEKFKSFMMSEFPEVNFTQLTFGFEHGKGWYPLVYNLTDCITNYLKHNEPQCTLHLEQVKEKMGGLRYYYSIGGKTAPVLKDPNAFSLIMGMVWFGESMSFNICEKCGKYGSLDTSQMWIKTLCEHHKELRRWKGKKKPRFTKG